MVAKPHWSLDRIKELAEKDKIFIQRGRALGFFSTLEEALDVVSQTLSELSERSFSHTVELTWDIADVYGVVREGAGWYLKLCIDEHQPEVAVISFHPLERPLRTRGGIVKP